jgi:hypothetical protein
MTEPLREGLIDAAAIEANTRTLRRLAHTREFIAVVKADGYGHGALTAARAPSSRATPASRASSSRPPSRRAWPRRASTSTTPA